MHAEQFGGAGLYRDDTARVQEFLSLAAEVHADIAQAFLAAAGVIHLAGVDADRFTYIAGTRDVIIVIATHGTGAADFIRHNDYLQKIMGNNYITVYSKIPGVLQQGGIILIYSTVLICGALFRQQYY